MKFIVYKFAVLANLQSLNLQHGTLVSKIGTLHV